MEQTSTTQDISSTDSTTTDSNLANQLKRLESRDEVATLEEQFDLLNKVMEKDQNGEDVIFSPLKKPDTSPDKVNQKDEGRTLIKTQSIIDSEEEFKHRQILLDGYVFLKYGSWGEPGYRLVNLSSDFKLIRWFHHGETKPSGTMPLDSLLGVKFGRHTPNFKRKPAQKPEQEALSFSIIGEKRNLDLEAGQKDQMDLFVEGLVSVMRWLKKKKKEEEALKKKK